MVLLPPRQRLHQHSAQLSWLVRNSNSLFFYTTTKFSTCTSKRPFCLSASSTLSEGGSWSWEIKHLKFNEVPLSIFTGSPAEYLALTDTFPFSQFGRYFQRCLRMRQHKSQTKNLLSGVFVIPHTNPLHCLASHPGSLTDIHSNDHT